METLWLSKHVESQGPHNQGVPRGCCDVTLFLPHHARCQGHPGASSPGHSQPCVHLGSHHYCTRTSGQRVSAGLGRPPSPVPLGPALLPLARHPAHQIPQPRGASLVTRAQASALSTTTLGVHHTPLEMKGYSRCAHVPQECLFQERGEGLISHL